MIPPKDSPTVSVLSIMPTKENDGSTYRCSVWNRALGQRQKLEGITKIDVNCKSSYMRYHLLRFIGTMYLVSLDP